MKLKMLTMFMCMIFLINSTYSMKVVFDTSVGFFGLNNDSSVGFSILKEEMEKKGFNVDNNIKLGENAGRIEKTLLKKSNIFVIVNPNRNLSLDELTLLRDFVMNGKKLILICDKPESLKYINIVSEWFGAKFLPYYLGRELQVKNVKFISPMPLCLEMKPEISLKVNCTAKEWKSTWELPEKNICEDEFTIFAGMSYGKGKIAFLGDKDFLMNENITKNMEFVDNILDWLQQGKPNDKIIFSPETLEFLNGKNGSGICTIRIENIGEVTQHLIFKIPEYLKDIIILDTYDLYIQKGEIRFIKVISVGSSEYSYLQDFIIIEREFGLYKYEDYIQIKVIFDEKT